MRYIILLVCITLSGLAEAAPGVRLKELARVEGVRDHALVGYGLVVGLAGTGDGPRNRATRQSLANTLANFGVNVAMDDLASRNAAAVMVTATLTPFAGNGERLDVHVSSMGDARSLLGGTLLLTPLHGPDERLYALAQGPMSVGGYAYDAFGNVVQKNHPTVGVIPDGATVERALEAGLDRLGDGVSIILSQPDFTTAGRVVDALRVELPGAQVHAEHAGKVVLRPADSGLSPVALVARIENTKVEPDLRARVVVNERTGTVVAGGDVRIADISISHGDLKVTITTDFRVSQPQFYSPVFIDDSSDAVRTAIVPDSEIDVEEEGQSAVTMPAGTTVAELVGALRDLKLSTRDVITILQAIKGAGALHGELIVQ